MSRKFIERVRSKIENGNVSQETKKTLIPEIKKTPPAGRALIFDDTDVCNLLSIRKRVLVDARKAKARGEDWDAVNMQVGMTPAWVKKKNPNVDVWQIKPIEAHTEIVTVQLTERYQNPKVAGVIVVATGTKAVAHVKDTRMMFKGEQFDCVRAGGKYYMSESLNPERY